MSDSVPHPRRWNLALPLTLALLGCSADLWTKSVMFRWLGPPQAGRVHWIVPEYVGFQTSINQGALFGIGQGQVTVLAIISVLAASAILVWLIWGQAGDDRILGTALGLILAGILGNLYDRLGLWGFRGVRDWILLQYGEFVWPNFNIADSLLVCGAILVAGHSMLHRPGASPAEPIHATETR